ncbi:MAG: NADH-quinone oxidoreductase subunit C [Sulfolobaceae archaeon]
MSLVQQKIADKVAELIKSKLPNLKIKVDSENRLSIEVDKGEILSVAKVLKEIGFDHVKSVTGTDYPDQERIEVVYHISSYSNIELAKVILALRTYVTYKDPTITSLYSVWESAWTGERETYEMLGVIFQGHPNLSRLFLPEDFEGVYPLRKSYKIKLEGLFVDRESE